MLVIIPTQEELLGAHWSQPILARVPSHVGEFIPKNKIKNGAVLDNQNLSHTHTHAHRNTWMHTGTHTCTHAHTFVPSFINEQAHTCLNTYA